MSAPVNESRDLTPDPEQTVAGHPPDDLDLLAEVDRRPGRTTVSLLAGILLTLAFLGGVLIQKHTGESPAGAAGSRTAAAASGFGGRGGASGFGGAGGFAGAPPGGAQAGAGSGAGGAAGGVGQAGADGTGGASANGTRSGTAATPVVVGTVSKLSAGAMTVKNLGGKSVPVTLPPGATVSLVTDGKRIPELAVGATVNVAGTTATDGSVTATTVTVRP